MKEDSTKLPFSGRQIILVIIILLIGLVYILRPVRHVYSEKMLFLGTTVRISIVEDNADRARQALTAAFALMKKYDDMCNFFSPRSELTHVNNEAAKKKVKVSKDMFAIIRDSLKYSRLTDGVFDVTATSLHKAGGYDTIELNARDRTVHFTNPRTKIDLGGITDGFCIDRIREHLRSMGINNYLINSGGDIYASGCDIRGKPWSLGIQDPFKKNGLVYRFSLTNEATTTSGNYLRKHIVFLKGHPAGPRTISVTVTSPTCLDADVYATTFFIMGPAKTREFIKKQKADYLQAFFIMQGKTKKFTTEKVNWRL